VVFDEVQERSPLPLISILEETCRKTKEMGFKKPGLLGTGFTMRADFYQKVFSREGLPLAVPEEADIDLIHKRLFTEIELGIIKDSTRQELIEIIGRMVEKHGIDSIILGCTELPLILDKPEYGVPVLNTTQIHVDAIVRECRG
jgi:aspartate racemase